MHTEKEFVNVSVYNPFTDEFEELDAIFESVYQAETIIAVSLVSVTSAADVELFEYLPQGNREEIERAFLDSIRG